MHQDSIHVCLRVCVCETERERERGGERENGEGLEWGGSLAEKVFGSVWGRGRGRH